MPKWAYLVTIFAYLAFVMAASILIDDLTLIFGIIAGLAECSTVFILPSVFYLIACNTELKQEQAYLQAVKDGKCLPREDSIKRKGGGPLTIIGVYVYLILGIVYFGLSNYFNFAKIFR